MDVLADSGILLRLLEPIDPLHATIDQAVRALHDRGDRIVIAPQNAAEFWNVCTRPATAKGGYGLSIAETNRRLTIIEAVFAVLSEPSSAYRLWRSLVMTQAVQGKQVHDARLVALMQAHGITHILTLNGSDFSRYPGITPIDPASLAHPPPPLPAIPQGG
ncbi:MAG TPA: type II toxin-antitoxin system VapC family toxin [Gemmataceae bacterium]|nr:type II toxin-antitoxin system VapC family toxin [Gemmataceae bacterium]